MNAVAVRKSGAPSVSIRAFSLVLAALATGIPLFLLLLGLSIKTVQAIRESRMMVDLIAVPPPPPMEPPQPAPVRRADRAAAPSLAEPRPASLIDRSPTQLPVPPAPAIADVGGTGAGATPGNGLDGNGPGGNGTGPSGGTREPVRAEASWIYRPENRELLPYSPPRAGVEGVNGQVLLACRVLRNGRATDCRVISERPRSYGFGKAAIRASVLFRLNPPTIDGEPDEARRVAIPVSFNNRR